MAVLEADGDIGDPIPTDRQPGAIGSRLEFLPRIADKCSQRTVKQ
jgi:hypothetical protein